MSKLLPCYHVTTAQGETYGVAATSVRDAMGMTQDRLSAETTAVHTADGFELVPTGDRPVRAKRVDMWSAEYGTVLHY